MSDGRPLLLGCLASRLLPKWLLLCLGGGGLELMMHADERA